MSVASSRHSLSVLIALWFLLASHSIYAAESEVLKPEAKRITDQNVGVDLSILRQTQDRIAKLNTLGTGADNYYLVKAQAWLDFATQEYYVNDRGPVTDQALFQARNLIERMEQAQQNISLDTPVIPESERLREDLWEIAAELKKHQGFACAAAPLAEMEVRLVWAGHENKELGWRHAREHFAAAERLAKRAQKLADNCFCPKPEDKPCPMVAAQATPEPVVVPKVIDEVKPVLSLVNVPRNVHFALDKSDINPKGALILDRVAEILVAYPKMSIILIGHTDSRASQAYNQALSERRAKSVLKYLAQKGIANSRMDIKGEGFNQIKTAEDELLGHALSRRVEIAYMGENIQSYDQTGDIVVEEMRKAKLAKTKVTRSSSTGKKPIKKAKTSTKKTKK